MDEKNDFPKRKELRIKHYDYSSRGWYFITICTQDRKRMLSAIIQPKGVNNHDDLAENEQSFVGVGALDDPFQPEIRLTQIGKIVERNLLSSQNISGIAIDQYVIMPDHIHAIVFLDPEKYIKGSGGSSKAPTPTNEMLPHIVSTFKRFCNKEIGENIFQRGYMEHVIRDHRDYEEHLRYMYNNPKRWYYEKLKEKQS